MEASSISESKNYPDPKKPMHLQVTVDWGAAHTVEFAPGVSQSFSHCNSVFPGTAGQERGSFPPQPHQSAGWSGPSAHSEGAQQGSSRLAGAGVLIRKREPNLAINGPSHVSITLSIKQHISGRFACLFDSECSVLLVSARWRKEETVWEH